MSISTRGGRVAAKRIIAASKIAAADVAGTAAIAASVSGTIGQMLDALALRGADLRTLTLIVEPAAERHTGGLEVNASADMKIQRSQA